MHNPENTKRSSTGNLDAKHLCQSCGRIYSSMSALKLHQRNGCQIIQVHHCTECNFKTNVAMSLNRHMMVKHNPGTIMYKCGHCSFMTRASHVLKSHLTKEHNKEISSYELGEEDEEELKDVQQVEEVFTLDDELQ